MHQVYLGLGSNLGDRESLLREAVRLLGERVGTVVRQSSVIETEPWGYQSSHRFLNMVVLCETSMTPRQVLTATQQIERRLGRHKNTGPVTAVRSYADRPIDIDILLYDQLELSEPGLCIPHPHMLERDFVMIPLREIQETTYY